MLIFCFSQTDQALNTTSYAYDGEGRLLSVTDSLGGLQKYTYDGAGNPVSSTDANGNTTQQNFDALRRIVKRVDPQGNAKSFQYNYLGKLSQVIDPLRDVQSYQYDPAGRLIASINALGKAKNFTYDRDGNLLSLTDELGRKTGYRYDPLNRVAALMDPLGNETQYQYDTLGKVVKVTYANGSSYTYQYDQMERLIGETNQLGKAQSYVYDPAGDLVAKTDFDGHATSLAYDPLRRLTEADYFNGTKKSFQYDAVGNIVHAENQNSSLDFSYDAERRLTQSTDHASGQTLTYAYDHAGNRTGLNWIQQNQAILSAYDNRNELIALTDASGKRTTFTYDALGRESSRSLPNGVVTTSSYDPVGRLVAVKNGRQGGWHSASVEDLQSEAYVFDDAGQRSYTVNSDGDIIAYQYDGDGRLIGLSYPLTDSKIAADLKERVALGLVTGGQPSGTSNQKHWGSDVDDAFQGLPFSQLRDFDPDSLKSKLENLGKSGGRSWLFGLGQGHRGFGDRLQLDFTSSRALSQAYQLISDGYGGRWGGGLDTDERTWTEDYTYDAQGNRLSETNGWGKVSYAYNSANQMLSAGARQYGYDANGSLIQESVNGGKAIYSYTADNRIDEVTTNLIDAFAGGLGVGFANFQPSGIDSSLWSGTRDVSYRYDPFGRRVSRIASLSLTETQESSAPSTPTHKARIVYDPVEHRSVIITDDGGMSSTATSTTTSVNHRDQATQQYLYDGLGFDVLAELNGSSGSDHDDGFGGRMGNTTAEYLKANGALVERQGLGERSGWWSASYYIQDTLGSTLQMTDPNGQVQTSYAYDAFGTMYQGDLSGGNAYGYTGKRHDPAVGLYDFGFRDYNSIAGRWTTLDPIRQGNNWYAYAENDPINLIDLWGLDVGNAGRNGYQMWTAQETVVGAQVGVAFPDPSMNTMAGAGLASVTFTNTETGETVGADYSYSVTGAGGYMASAGGGLSKSTFSQGFPDGTSKDAVAASFAGQFTSLTVSASAGLLSTSFSYTNGDEAWSGVGLSVGLSLGPAVGLAAVTTNYSLVGTYSTNATASKN